MKAKILNLGTVINKTAQKQILGGTPKKCPGDGVWGCRGKEPYIDCKCYYKAHEVLRPE
ncbi:hypothetical protein HER15_03010 [Tenacibaculum mesophilum]|uniref:Uncharacterized protein n=1 Tax=Tenacibaculum mesophilum TaxID=104268 RepID=A0AAE9SG72_9FLAO|nr:hypothetical protein [Tenacibaculum mesophilum]UTD14504.1 hypothetical protein HER15_03010 [Tenacibaculum mesophilum]